MLCLLNYMLMLSSMLIKVRVVHFGFRTVPHRLSARLQVSYCLLSHSVQYVTNTHDQDALCRCHHTRDLPPSPLVSRLSSDVPLGGPPHLLTPQLTGRSAQSQRFPASSRAHFL